MENQHFLLIACPFQGHLNPMLQLAKNLRQAGAARVTFATTVHGLTQIKTFPSLDGLYFASFSDGFDDGIKHATNSQDMLSELKRAGSQTLTELILTFSKNCHPVSFLIYTLILPWAADVARYMSIPSAFLYIQSATSLALCHHFFNRHGGVYDLYNSSENKPPSSIQLPGLPPFETEDIPSFLLPNGPHSSLNPVFQHHIQVLEQEPSPRVLLNSFDCLEEEVIAAIGNINPIPIGPLIPFALLDKNHQSDASCGCDLFEKSTEYTQWLNSKPKRPFLWIIRSSDNKDTEFEEMVREKVNKEKGLIVPWCSQMEVLAHESIGCYMMHCGWNSTMESLAAGIPVVGLPQFADQTTSAKMIEEVWGNGVRARVNEVGIVEAEEIRRCLEVVIGSGEKGQEIRSNAKKWSGLALDAVKDGGSSHNNLKAFLENVTTSAKMINGVFDEGAENKTKDATKPNENSKN
ncbi:phloretin 4'-O-glucosyltransferase [Populus alba]|uniref:phloretin 4'-O-glucosyltransferase n=1 Tax=Populus alba TaxID=43335 RepID=UPI00158CF92B|nr:UDP-glycosyltransferase 75C1-like [Populus alba]